MRRLFFIAAALLAAGAARADQWYYVDFEGIPVGSPNECIAVPSGQDPVSSMKAVLGPVHITVLRDEKFADGSRFMNVTLQNKNSAYTTTVARCHQVRKEIAQEVAIALAGQDKWYVAQYRGDCVELSDAFSGMSTPEQLHKAMTRRGRQLSLKRGSKDIVLMTDDLGHYPPLVMVRGLARCRSSSAAQIASQ
jgi:hypothetical protein